MILRKSLDFLMDFKIKTYYSVPTRRPDQLVINKRQKNVSASLHFTVRTDYRIKGKQKKKKFDKYLNLARELKINYYGT